MRMGVDMDAKRAVRKLTEAGGPHLATALRRGYSAAARVIRDKAKATAAFRDRSGLARKSWRIRSMKRPYNQARLFNLPHYTRWLEAEPRNYAYLEKAARSSEREVLNAVAKAVRAYVTKLNRSK